MTDSFPLLPSTIWGSESFITKVPPTDLRLNTLININSLGLYYEF